MKRFLVPLALLALAACSQAPDLDEVPLSTAGDSSGHVPNVQLNAMPDANSLTMGYSSSSRTYNETFIRNLVTHRSSSPIVADVYKSFELINIRMESSTDGGRCPAVQARRAPDSAAFFVWTLKTEDPRSNRLVTVEQDTREIKTLPPKRSRGSTCFPTEQIKVLGAAGAKKFSVPIPVVDDRIGAVRGTSQTYTVQFDILDSTKKVILTRTKAIKVQHRAPLIVSIGDSYASGECNPDKAGDAKDAHYNPFVQRDCEDDTAYMIKRKKTPEMKVKPVWFDERDHRSLRSGPALAAKSLLGDYPYLQFLTFAKSGAETSTTKEDDDIIEQLDRVKELLEGTDTRIDTLLISAGGNDVGFSTALESMAGDFLGNESSEVWDMFQARLDELRDVRYPQLKKAIESSGLNIGTVIITEYPTNLFGNENGEPSEGCGVFDNFRYWKVTEANARLIRGMGNELNWYMKEAANDYGWKVVDGISEAFDKHGYCTAASYYRSAEDSCDMQGDFKGIMHPNEKGTQVYADAIARAIRSELPSDRLPVGVIQPPVAAFGR